MKITVIHHSADYDGIFCREVARKFLPDAELIGWDFADRPLDVPQEGQVYILDLPVDRPFGWTMPNGWDAFDSYDGLKNRLVWIDHHKTSIDSHPRSIPGYRIDGVAACRLAWEYFTGNHRDGQWPEKRQYVERILDEPLAVRLAGEYDIWDKRDPRAETFQYALRAVDPNWELLLGENSEFHTQAMCDMGVNVQNYARRNDESICKHKSFILEWGGLRWLCINTARFNSLFFSSRDIPETGHDALLGFVWGGKNWTVSLYHSKHNAKIDLSEIAKKYGGGGHRGACGFTAKKLPFNLC